mmetsp:Transcript_42563/g.101058  ORF Transcript_42563/g.101058 Transcript_42563/m.101058 type:complete len:247 (+) Transcript_42563:1125-1865(+)
MRPASRKYRIASAEYRLRKRVRGSLKGEASLDGTPQPGYCGSRLSSSIVSRTSPGRSVCAVSRNCSTRGRVGSRWKSSRRAAATATSSPGFQRLDDPRISPGLSHLRRWSRSLSPRLGLNHIDSSSSSCARPLSRYRSRLVCVASLASIGRRLCCRSSLGSILGWLAVTCRSPSLAAATIPGTGEERQSKKRLIARSLTAFASGLSRNLPQDAAAQRSSTQTVCRRVAVSFVSPLTEEMCASSSAS